MILSDLSNYVLWSRYKQALNDLCRDPDDLSKSAIVVRIEKEIASRLMAAGAKPLPWEKRRQEIGGVQPL